MKISRSTWITLTATLLLVGFSLLFVDTVPPRSKTAGAMHMAKRRILRYASAHNALPNSLAQTAEIPGYDNSLKDGWGRALLYRVATNGDVILTSLGKDNKVGGANDDADMTGIFSSRKPDGSWSDEAVEWKQDPFLRSGTQ